MDHSLRQTDFELLIQQQKANIYSVCYMFADTKAKADDLFQEVLIKLWNGFSDFRGESDIRSWIYRISLNTCISIGRKKLVKTIPVDLSPDIFDESSTIGKQTAMLHERILKLDKFDRAIVLLWLEDMSYDEIAAIVGIKPKAVGVRLVRIIIAKTKSAILQNEKYIFRDFRLQPKRIFKWHLIAVQTLIKRSQTVPFRSESVCCKAII